MFSSNFFSFTKIISLLKEAPLKNTEPKIDNENSDWLQMTRELNGKGE